MRTDFPESSPGRFTKQCKVSIIKDERRDAAWVAYLAVVNRARDEYLAVRRSAWATYQSAIRTIGEED